MDETMDSYSEVFDKCLACLLLLFLVVGVASNLVAFTFFYKNRKSINKLMYMIIALTDTFSCANTFPVILVLFSKRRPVLFGNQIFTQLWGITWEPLPYLSAFLVMVMTGIRAVILLKPLVVWNKNKILCVVLGYYCFLLTRFCVGVAFFGKYKFESFSGYAWIHVVDKTYQDVDLLLAVTLMVIPILPVLILSSISFTKIILTMKNTTKNKKVEKIKRRSSITVLIFATTYILFNIPVFVTFLWYVLMAKFDVHIFNYGWFLHYYLWVITFVFLVAINAFFNPIIYFCRMTDYRQFISLQSEQLQLGITSFSRRRSASIAIENPHAEL